MKTKQVGDGESTEKDALEGNKPLAHKIYEAHILRDNFKDKMLAFLEGDDSEIILGEIVDSPLKIDILEKLNYVIVGQDDAKKHLADAIMNAIETVEPKKNGPLKVLFFAGNTGVGKTETAKVLGEICFGEGYLNNGVTIIPCEQYSEEHSARNIFGSPKSYVGFGDPTQLSDINLFKPYREARSNKKLHESLYKLDDFAILVFDEIEKAHHKVVQGLLGILSSGIHEFPTGVEDDPKNCKYSKITDFKNVIIIFTSNVGTAAIQKRGLGFGAGDEKPEEEKSNIQKSKQVFKKEMEKHFSAEFIGRIDEDIFFHDLSEENCRQIIKNSIDYLNLMYSMYYDYGMKIDVTENAIQQLLKEGFDKKTGARKLKRIIYKHIENRINNYMVSGGVERMLSPAITLSFVIDFSDGEFKYKTVKLPKSVSSKTKVINIVNHIMKKRQTSVVYQALYPNVIPIMSEVMFLQDRYRRVCHLFYNEGLAIEKELKVYEFMLRELGHTEADIEFQQKLAEVEIFDPKDVFTTYAFNCEFPVSSSVFYGADDAMIEEIVNSVIQRNPNMTKNKLYEKIFKTVNFLLGIELNETQIQLLRQMVGSKINVIKR